MRLKNLLIITSIILIAVSFSSCDILETEETLVEFVSGSLEGWDLGSGYELKFGYHIDETDEFLVYGSSPIESDGSFSIEQLAIPPEYVMERVGKGPADNDGCTGSVEVSDENVMIAFGKFKITETGSNDGIGSAYLANHEMNSEIPEVGNYIIEFVYSESEISLFGVDDCTHNSNFVETIQVDIFIQEGWNKVTNETVFLSQNETIRNFVSGAPDDARWFYKMHDDPDDTEYAFHVNGQFDNWTQGSSMTIQFGMDDYTNNQFKVFAETDISANGSFSFDYAFAPPSHLLIPVQYGPGAPGDCDVNLTASDPYVLGGSGYFVIMNKETNEFFGYAGPGYKNPESGHTVVGDYDIIFIFVNNDVNINGTVYCIEQVEDHVEADNTIVDLNLVKGWNMTKNILTVEHDEYNRERQIDVITSMPNDVVWYYTHNAYGINAP